MAVKTVTVGSGGSDYDAGWKQLTIKNAKYDNYNGNKFIDIWFDDYPDNMNARVYETINKTTKEEFRISSWFRFANAGILEVIDNGSGKPVVKYDDDVENLSGKEINVLFYRETTGDGEYARIWREPAPIMTETDTGSSEIPYTEKDVSFWKTRSERSLNSWQAKDGQTETSVNAITQSVTDIPTGVTAERAPF